MFERADPYGKGAEKVSARELLDTGAARVSSELEGDPEVQAALMDAIGRASLGLGRLKEAAPLLERALARRRDTAPASPELADSLENVAWLRFLQSDFDAAEPLMREAVALRRRLLGDRSRLAFTLNRLGTLLAERHQTTDEERLSEIEALHREAFAIYRQAGAGGVPGVADSLFHLARLSRLRGKLDEAERLDRQVLRINLASRGARHLETAFSRRLLALTLIDRGKFDEAGEQLRLALAAQQAVLPADHPDLAATRNDLALARLRRGAYGEAEELFREVLRFHLATFGEDHASTAVVLSNLASALQGQGKLEEAAVLHDRSLAVKLALYGERHIYVAQTLGSLARVRSEQGRHGKALDLAGHSLAINRALLAPDHPELAWPLRTLGIALHAAGRPAEAEPFLRQSLDLLRRKHPAGFQRWRAEVLLGACLTDLGRFAEAGRLLAHGRAALEAELPADHERVREARDRSAEWERARRLPRVAAQPIPP